MNGGGRVRQIRYLLGEIYELEGYEESFNSFPAIAAHVAANARMYLWSLMKQAGRNNYFYCDTDSLVINELGLCRLKNKLNDYALGSLKIEQAFTSMTIRGLKDYSIGTKLVIKGIRKNAVQIEDGVYEQEQWSSFKGLLRAGEPNTYTIKKVRKVLERKYTKGHVNPNGLIQPLVLDDLAIHSPLLF